MCVHVCKCAFVYISSASNSDFNECNYSESVWLLAIFLTIIIDRITYVHTYICVYTQMMKKMKLV